MALNPLRKWLSPDDPVASAPEEPAADDDIPGLRSSLSLLIDYLPTSIDTYLALPPQFLVSHRNAAGETPAEELVAQVTTLRGGLIELAQSVYAGDSERLSSQRRFLETKFTKSDLDL